MINIRPVSDLRNKYPEIENIVLKEDEEVYLTKNGYGSMVVMSIERYSKLMQKIYEEKAMEDKYGNTDIKQIEDEIDEEIKNSNTEFLNNEEVFINLRRKLYEE